MSDDDKPATMGSIHAELLALARRLLGSQAAATLLLMIACGWAVLYGYRALAQQSHDAGVDAAHQVEVELQRVKEATQQHARDSAVVHAQQQQQQDELRRRIENTERLTLETNLNVRLLLDARGVKPITLSPSGDAGQ